MPTQHELAHDYLWRHYKALPAAGEIGIFNRSHYENVLVTRVHPEYLMNNALPGIDSIEDINQTFWNTRFEQIRNFEQHLSDNGTVILKFFLHVSKKEQKQRFLDRIDNASKNWKFSTGDVKERAYWDAYQKAYEDMLGNTSTNDAPWFVVPADDKWFTRLSVAGIIYNTLERLNIEYPTVSSLQKSELEKAKQQLLNE